MPDPVPDQFGADFSQAFPYPDAFWIAAILLAGLGLEALLKYRTAWSKPALAIYLTIGVWYLYNMVYDTPGHFVELFPPELIATALHQVSLFLVVFRLAVPGIARAFAGGLVNHPGYPRYDPRQLQKIFGWLLSIWACLFLVGMIRVDFNVLAIIWPPTSKFKIHMFSRQAIGGGLDFLLSSTQYIYILVCALFGVFFALGNARLRAMAGTMMLLTWPYFFFDRTRNTMLAVFLPGLMAYWFLSPGKLVRKAVISAVLLGAINYWFLVVMHARQSGVGTRMEAYVDTDQDLSDVRHEGLNMLEELCWIDCLIENGELQITPGARYFGELVNVVPRTIWPGKPRVGYDYAIARGKKVVSDEGEVVNTTISTGMIGQGVHNFGMFFGVIAAALLMACWAAFLAKLWMQRDQLPRAALFMVGIGLTFNMGRDVTLLVLWPLVFGYLGVRLAESRLHKER